MKQISLIILVLFFVGCSTTPKEVPVQLIPAASEDPGLVPIDHIEGNWLTEEIIVVARVEEGFQIRIPLPKNPLMVAGPDGRIFVYVEEVDPYDEKTEYRARSLKLP